MSTRARCVMVPSAAGTTVRPWHQADQAHQESKTVSRFLFFPSRPTLLFSSETGHEGNVVVMMSRKQEILFNPV